MRNSHKGMVVAEQAAKKEETVLDPPVDDSAPPPAGDEGQTLSAEKKESPGEKKNPAILLGIIIFNSVATLCLVGFFFVLNRWDRDPDKIQVSAVQEEAEPDGAVRKYDGKFIPIAPFLVNVTGVGGDKAIKISMEFKTDNAKAEEEVIKIMPQIRDIIISLLSNKTYDQIRDKDVKNSLRTEVRDAVNARLVKGKITEVYFTNMLVN